jgi:uncharacterized protein
LNAVFLDASAIIYLLEGEPGIQHEARNVLTGLRSGGAEPAIKEPETRPPETVLLPGTRNPETGNRSCPRNPEPGNRSSPRKPEPGNRKPDFFPTPSMRLTQQQINTIKKATEEVFGPDANVWLFGSRVDDARRGGDIDLMIETDAIKGRELLRKRIKLLARLKTDLGDQQIDLVVQPAKAQTRPHVVEVARQTGIRL